MNTSTIKDPSFMDTTVVDTGLRLRPPYHDVAEVAIGFGQHNAARLSDSFVDSPDFLSATISGVTFRRVDPLREPLRVADARLQDHLEQLCEALRAKY